MPRNIRATRLDGLAMLWAWASPFKPGHVEAGSHGQQGQHEVLHALHAEHEQQEATKGRYHEHAELGPQASDIGAR